MNIAISNVVYPERFHSGERSLPEAVNTPPPSVQTLPDYHVRVVRFIPVYYDVTAVGYGSLEEACAGALNAVNAGQIEGELRESDASPFCVNLVFSGAYPGAAERVPAHLKFARVCADWATRIAAPERS